MSSLTASLGFLIRRVQQRLSDEFHIRFAAEELTPARYALLRLVQANPYARQADFGVALSIKQSNLAVLINSLEAESLLIRKTDSADRRNNLLVLAPAGRKLLRRIQPAIEAMETEVSDRLGPELKSVMAEALRRLAGI